MHMTEDTPSENKLGSHDATAVFFFLPREFVKLRAAFSFNPPYSQGGFLPIFGNSHPPWLIYNIIETRLGTGVRLAVSAVGAA